MPRKSRRFGTDSADRNQSENEINSLFDYDTEQFKQNRKKRLLYPILGFCLVLLLGFGAMASNNWLPHTDAFSGKRTGWFGAELASNAPSGWNPAAASTTASTPQLSKEYIYAGSRMLAVEDAGANAAAAPPPSDLAVWRPSSGVWYVMGATNSDYKVSMQFGSPGDIPAPGDYDGDGQTDFCVYRRPPSGSSSDSVWYVQPSGGGSFYGVGFGLATDLPVAADYDGDGKTDIAVWRPSNGTWYWLRSSDGSFTGVQYGQSGDVPVPRDFDGDKKADPTVLRPGAGIFYTLRSSDNAVQTQTGVQAGDAQVSADYDGDGKADYAVRRGADWIYVQSTDGALRVINWQQSGDKAVQNDYDGDGKVDIAVWRDATGVWYIRQSSKIGQADELRQVQWGTTGDIPVPAFYRR